MGFPTRAAIDDFGPEIAGNTRAVRDPTKELDFRSWNLMRHQVAGLGLVAPLALLQFTSANPPVIQARAEAWNPKRLSTGLFADPTPTRNGAGDYTWAWTSPTVDEQGNSVPVTFTYAMGWVVEADNPGTLKHVRCAVLTANRNRIRVKRFDAAGSLEEAGSIVVLAW